MTSYEHFADFRPEHRDIPPEPTLPARATTPLSDFGRLTAPKLPVCSGMKALSTRLPACQRVRLSALARTEQCASGETRRAFRQSRSLLFPYGKSRCVRETETSQPGRATMSSEYLPAALSVWPTLILSQNSI